VTEEQKQPEAQTSWWMGATSLIQLALGGNPWTLHVPGNATYGDVAAYANALAKVIEDAQAKINEEIEEQKKAQEAEKNNEGEGEEPKEDVEKDEEKE
jgi:hypothetical protein